MKETILPSGLVLVEGEVPDPPKVKDPTGSKCAYCDNRSVEESQILCHWTKDGFVRVNPTCHHEDFLLCPDCRSKYLGCPVCGCGEEFC